MFFLQLLLVLLICDTSIMSSLPLVCILFLLHSVKKQVQLQFSCTAVSPEDSSATDLLMLQTQYCV